jgi:hypothetical protein
MISRIKIIFIIIALGSAAFIFYDAKYNYVNWQTAKRDSSGLAPLPNDEKRAVVQVYVARTYNWRGYFAVHPWISIKEKDADHYTTYQVTAWNLRRNRSSVWEQKDIPDRYWFGREPVLLQTLIGEEAEKAIPEIKKAIADYPYAERYELWPGPNSNTFISYIIRNVPELTVELPPNAIGKDFLGLTKFFAKSESGRGFQISILGILGITAGLAEGIEVNVMTLNFGIDFWNPALKFPLFGRIGMPDRPL